MKASVLVLVVVILFFIMYLQSRNNSPYEMIFGDNISENTLRNRNLLRSDSFVDPKDSMIHIFEQMSSKNKIKLHGDCNTSIYTRNTLPENKNVYIIDVMSLIIQHINFLDNRLDYYLKKIDQVYEQIDVHGNKRYVVVAFIYDIRNYYTLKIFTDFVKLNNRNEVIINSIGNQFSSNYNILNRYDFTIFSRGFLQDSNMFNKDVISILEENYRKYSRLIGINNTSLENSVYMINRHGLNNSNLDDYTREYFPEGMPQVEFGPFCKKHMNDWDGAGVKLENKNIPTECVSNNNSTLLKLNRPYFAPGVVTQRVDDNAYSWLADPGRGANGPSTVLH
jgi:hypothetical protein